MVVVCFSTQLCFIVTQSLCVASPLFSPQLRRFSGWIFFCFFATPKTAQKERFGSDTFWGLVFLAVPLNASPIFVAFCELKIRYVLGLQDFLCFLGPSFLFFEGVKNLIWGVGKKNVARVMRGLWLGTMMMGASRDILTFQCRHT